MKYKRIIIAEPHGFCSGVYRAVDAVETALRVYDPPIYCLHEVVHNRQVVEELSTKGVRFVEDIDDVPPKSLLLFSAHGVSPAVKDMAKSKGLNVIDATCPFVSKVHAEVRRCAADGKTVLIVGDKNHDEVVGLIGEAPCSIKVVEHEDDALRVQVFDINKVGVVCQTTINTMFADKIISILRSRFPGLTTSDKQDICYATRNRQRAVQALGEIVDLLLVLGSPSSANTRRLVEVGHNTGCNTVLISDQTALQKIQFSDIRTIGVTSGASTPERFLENIVNGLRVYGFNEIEKLTVVKESSRRFMMPVQLKNTQS